VAGGGAAAVTRAEEGAEAAAVAAEAAASGRAKRAGWTELELRHRQRSVLVLFEGPRRQDSLVEAFRSRGWAAEGVDILQGKDLASGRTYKDYEARARAAEFDLVFVASPCNTYSVARFREGGEARPVRRRSTGGRIPGLTASERWAVDETDLLVDRAAKLAELVVRAGGEFVWENPIDRGDPTLAYLGAYSEPDHFPLWLEPTMRRLQDITDAQQLHLAQCYFGSPFQKLTTLLASPGAAALLAPGLARAVCLHERHESVARGYDAAGGSNSIKAAAYPAGMHEFLTDALGDGSESPAPDAAAGAVAGGGTRAGSGATASSRQHGFERWLCCWEEAPALRRAMAESQAAAGRFSMATLLPEHKSVVRRAWAESAEDLDTEAAARSDWRRRSGQVDGAQPLVRQCAAARHPLAPVDVGHCKRAPRPGYTPVWVGRGGASALGNPFLLQGDRRPAAARAETSVRDAACDAYAALLRDDSGDDGAAARLAGGLAVAGDGGSAAQRASQLAALQARVLGGERLQLMCTCHPRRCHADELASWLLDAVGWVDPGDNGDVTAAAVQEWRPAGGARGLFWDGADWDAMQAWQERAALACDAALSGAEGEAGTQAPIDLHIPSARMRPEARALAPWRTGGDFAASPQPVTQLEAAAGACPPACGLRAHVFAEFAAGGDEEIAAELPWGLEDDAAGLDVYLAFHHPSCSLFPEAVAAVLEAEGQGPGGTGWLQDMGSTPYVPLRCVPKGVVDQVHKKRVVTDHTYPFGFGISANDGVGIGHLPEIKLSSGVKYAHAVAVMKSAGVGVLMWKRDAVSAYRQVPINPKDLWKCGLVGRSGTLVDVRLSFGARMAPNKFQRLMMVVVRVAMRRIRAFDAAHPPTDPGVVEWLQARREALGDAQARLAAVVQYIDDSLGCSVNDVIDATGRGRGVHHAEIFDAALAEAGVAMAEGEKRVDSADEVEALGVMVSAAEECVYYPEKKKERLRQRMEALLAVAAAGGRVSRAEVESVAGKQKWVAHIAPSLQPRLTSAFAMAHAKGRPATVVPSVAFIDDQNHILAALDTLPRRPLSPRSEFVPLDDGESTVIFQDASGTWGIGGFFVDGQEMVYFAEPYPTDVATAMAERRLSIGPAELAAELAAVLLALERRLTAPYFTDFTDNESARVAATKGTSSSPTMGLLAHALAAATTRAGVVLRTVRVTTKENAVADGLSRDGSTVAMAAAAAAAQLRPVRVGVPARVWDLLRESAIDSAVGPHSVAG